MGNSAEDHFSRTRQQLVIVLYFLFRCWIYLRSNTYYYLRQCLTGIQGKYILDAQPVFLFYLQDGMSSSVSEHP